MRDGMVGPDGKISHVGIGKRTLFVRRASSIVSSCQQKSLITSYLIMVIRSCSGTLRIYKAYAKTITIRPNNRSSTRATSMTLVSTDGRVIPTIPQTESGGGRRTERLRASSSFQEGRGGVVFSRR